MDILITTLIEIPVSFRVEHGAKVLTGEVIKGTTAKVEVNNSAAVQPTSGAGDAISVTTADPLQTISVVGVVSNANGSTDAFLATPIRFYDGITHYQSAQFSSASTTYTSSYSMFILVSCSDIVRPFLRAPLAIADSVPVKDVFRLFQDSREFIGDQETPIRRILPMEALHFENDTLDTTGVAAYGDHPFGFIAGHTCGALSDSSQCNYMIEQVPPTYTWGYYFVTAPFINKASDYHVRVVQYHSNTQISWSCSGQSAMSGSTTLLNEQYYDIEVNSKGYCYFEANSPVGVVQYVNSTNGPIMVWVTPANQYSSSYQFTTDISGFDDHYITVVIPRSYYNPLQLQLNGQVLLSNLDDWVAVLCIGTTQPCAYAYTASVSKGTHTLRHTHGGTLGLMVYGGDAHSGYAYPAGYKMTPIGGKAL